MYVCMYVCMCALLRPEEEDVCVCMYIYIHIYVSVFIYIHIYIYTRCLEAHCIINPYGNDRDLSCGG